MIKLHREYAQKVDKKEIVEEFVHEVKRRLLRKQRWNYVGWVIFSTIIMVINLIIITASISILVILFEHLKNDPSPSNYFLKIIGPILLLIFALLSLFLFSIISVFQTKTKRLLYKTAYRNLQFEIIKYNQKDDEYKGEGRAKSLRKNIDLIKKEVYASKQKKITFKRIAKSILLKDPND